MLYRFRTGARRREVGSRKFHKKLCVTGCDQFNLTYLYFNASVIEGEPMTITTEVYQEQKYLGKIRTENSTPKVGEIHEGESGPYEIVSISNVRHSMFWGYYTFASGREIQKRGA